MLLLNEIHGGRGPRAFGWSNAETMRLPPNESGGHREVVVERAVLKLALQGPWEYIEIGMNVEE